MNPSRTDTQENRLATEVETETLREQEALLHEMSALAKVGAWVFDPANGQCTWTEEIGRIYELDQPQPNASPFGLEFFHGAMGETLKQALRDALEKGIPYDLELEMTTAQGHHAWVRTLGHPILCDGRTIKMRGVLQDITERKRIEAALRASEQRFRTIMDHAPIGKVITAADGTIMMVNQAYCTMLGYTREELLGRTFMDITHPDDRNLTFPDRQKLLDGELETYQKAKRYLHKQGHTVWTHLTSSLVKCDGAEPYFIAQVIDITERKESEAQVQHLAFHDALTDLPNRTLITHRLQQALVTCARHESCSALLLIDLDNFKIINDMQGHASGDRVLQQVAQRLSSVLREGDTLARLGGDEFLVLLEGLHRHALVAAEQAEHVCAKLMSALQQPCLVGARAWHVSGSFGVTVFCSRETSTEELIRQADIAMYEAKKAGRNTLRFFDQNIQEQMVARVALESDLRQALEKGQLSLHYQIQVDSHHHPLGAEALLRWHHPERGCLSPAEFIPLAEESDLILSIDHWVLETACRQLHAWQAQPLMRDFALAVNISARQLSQPGFAEELGQRLQRHALSPGRLKLEITESMLLHNIENTLRTMNGLKALGVRFSLDDFGTGYSSLSQLKRLPLDQLKVDQSFIREITANAHGDDRAIVETIIGMAGTLGLEIIAEGVETEDQHRFLLEHGCHRFQGYLFGKPLPLDPFEHAVAQFARPSGVA